MNILNRWLLGVVVVLVAGCGINPQARNNQGNRFLEQGAIESSVRSYQFAQVAGPDAPVPYFNSGVAFLAEQDYARSEAALQQALLTADATLTEDIYFALGEVYFRQGQYAQAVDMYRQVLLRRDDEDARYNLELALSLIPTPTEPPLPTPTQGEGQDQESSTPTNTPTPTPQSPEDDPNNQTTPTPSPQSPEDSSPDEPESPAESDEDQNAARMEAESLLNEIQRQQNILVPQGTADPSGAPPEKDW